ncbi:serine/threonine protein phosphatase 4 [Plasmodium brasilianum]|uniref:Serine/threonine-protein phosphatase n=2 Tax=Plasmodium (Plasmodium) TaxID=418103 RepID=A0A1A8WY07_PLAMA|nr:serine/threonine protein phosphatase 4, putative [Plasmodium malariae]KAI4839507.1 serine/threonine protein phosphatase 4 [Plasmodium brasilianum]SBS96769.1 serine/threonine protein phosphatase 4, putative (PPP4) [Plasmodium malariae]SBT87930.1 serine/threonine protein phosphatase 4, putative [Plasmodium malariae]
MNSTYLEKQIYILKKCQLLEEKEVKRLCNAAKVLLIKEENIRNVNIPVIICGDIHGQFHDLTELFNIGNELPYINYIFLGDYVDRGKYSIETFLLLLALKLRYPDQITLIRGNHESRQITEVYGFYDECIKKYGSVNVWKYCTDVFDYLSVGALIENNYFCIHGGLSPSFNKIDELREIKRFQEIPRYGSLCDIMWSDPSDKNGWDKSPRGAGHLFGPDIVQKFCYVNNIEIIARAHQLVMEGYKWWFDKKLITIWSAPNYCYRCGNIASIMEIDENSSFQFKCFGPSTIENAANEFVKKQPPIYFS